MQTTSAGPYTVPPMQSGPEIILSERLLEAMRHAFGAALPPDADPLLAVSKNPEFGDFQCNAAMSLGKAMGISPRAAAERIVSALNIDDVALPARIAGPGFINLTLRPEALASALDAMDDGALGLPPPPPGARETIVVDLCGVNLAKQMHVGHLRATVIGDALARIWERLGHRVIRQNHFGDWGLPIAMVTERVKRLAEAGRVDLDSLTLEDLEGHYRAAQRDCDADERGLRAVERFGLGPKADAEVRTQVEGAREATARARQALVALQAHEPGHVRVWERISEVTLAACFENCRRLHATVTREATAGESTYAHELAPLVEDLLARRVAEVDDGAVIVRLDEFGIKEPCLVRKRDGGFLYATTDMAGIRRRVQGLGADRAIYAVDARQSLHFRQVFAASKKAGYARRAGGSDATLLHAAFGMVLGEDGRPFKTRSGENVRLSDLIDEAIARAELAVAQKNPDLPADERRAVAEAVGIGAIKYIDLSSDRSKDYVFSFDRMLAFEGNTGPYLQYALVRVRSILRKAHLEQGIHEDSLGGPGRPGLLIAAPEEKTLALAALKFPATLRGAGEACEPHRLCAYLYELASAFSAFFAACPVLSTPDERVKRSRLRLCRLTGRILRDGLEALGLVPLERM